MTSVTGTIDLTKTGLQPFALNRTYAQFMTMSLFRLTIWLKMHTLF
jgi:hypothetical protein